MESRGHSDYLLAGRYRLVFADTCVLSSAVQAPTGLGAKLLRSLTEPGLALGISFYNLLELRSKPVILAKVAALLVSVPSVLVKTMDGLFECEKAAYEGGAFDEVGLSSFNQYPPTNEGVTNLAAFLIGREMASFRDRFVAGQVATIAAIKNACTMWDASHGTPKKRREQFEQLFTFELLALRDPQFCRREMDQGHAVDITRFPSHRMVASLAFSKYCLSAAVPKPSDVADLEMASIYPYCATLLLERQMADLVRQTQAHIGIPRADVLTLTDLGRSVS